MVQKSQTTNLGSITISIGYTSYINIDGTIIWGEITWHHPQFHQDFFYQRMFSSKQWTRFFLYVWIRWDLANLHHGKLTYPLKKGLFQSEILQIFQPLLIFMVYVIFRGMNMCFHVKDQADYVDLGDIERNNLLDNSVTTSLALFFTQLRILIYLLVCLHLLTCLLTYLLTDWLTYLLTKQTRLSMETIFDLIDSVYMFICIVADVYTYIEVYIVSFHDPQCLLQSHDRRAEGQLCPALVISAIATDISSYTVIQISCEVCWFLTLDGKVT